VYVPLSVWRLHTDIDSHGNWLGHVRSPCPLPCSRKRHLLFLSRSHVHFIFRPSRKQFGKRCHRSRESGPKQWRGIDSLRCGFVSRFVLSWAILTLSYQTFPLSGAKTRGACQCNFRIRDVRSSDTRSGHEWR
jgi:hypothetical protein